MTNSSSSSFETIRTLFEVQQKNAPALRLRGAKERIDRLECLESVMMRRSQELCDAIFSDYGKSAIEVELTELFTILGELRFAKRHLRKWMRPQRVRTPLSIFGTKSEIRYDSKGVVLIIGAWNYPLHLVLIPLISALAAGNSAILKPSDLTPRTTAFITDLIEEVFPPEEVAVIDGDADTSQFLCSLPFDHVFFTGSAKIGKIVAEAAARNLSPCTLELGGKSPVIVTDSADLPSAAERIVWSKFLNSGQTCVAPDYVFVAEANAKKLEDELTKAIVRLHRQPDGSPSRESLCQIINQRHVSRLKSLLDESVAYGSQIASGGTVNEAERFIEPTIMTNVTLDSPVMREEIFGPILPIVTYNNRQEIYDYIRASGKPLALYVFSASNEEIEEVIQNTSSGGVTVNNTLVHLLNPHLPFGGTGASGIGNYHGINGFKTFSHARAVARQSSFNGLKLLYPPYTSRVKRCVKLATKFLT